MGRATAGLLLTRLCPKALISFACGLAVAAPAFGLHDAQDLLANVPLERWIEEGPRVQVPWKVRLFPVRLSIHQRLLARVEVQVDGTELVKRRGDGRLVALVQFKDREGNAYEDHATLELKDVQPDARKTVVRVTWEAFVLPGEYEVALALYDTVSGEHNLAKQHLRIDPLKQDPLRDAWRDLPNVELFQAAEGLDQFFRPEMIGRLRLPVETRRPVQLQLLANLSPSELISAHRRNNANLALLLPILKTFSQIDVQNGSLDVATLDVTRRRVTFEQNNVQELDWPGLKAALAATDPSVIDVKELQDSKQNAAFLRKELARRIEALGSRQWGQEADPLRIFILIGTPMAFLADSHENPLPSRESCDCRMYYLRYHPGPFGIGGAGELLRTLPTLRAPVTLEEMDAVARMLKPLKARVLSVDSAEGLRKALATLLAEISQL